MEAAGAASGRLGWQGGSSARPGAGTGTVSGAPSHATDGSVHSPVAIDNYQDYSAVGNHPQEAAAAGTPAQHDGRGVTIVDLCSGKGCQGVLLALRFPRARVVMCDSQASHEAVRPTRAPCVL